MLVIGFSKENSAGFHADLDIDVEKDAAQEIHDALSNEADGTQFDVIIVVEKDEVVAMYSAEEDDFVVENIDDDDDDNDDDYDLDD